MNKNEFYHKHDNSEKTYAPLRGCLREASAIELKMRNIKYEMSYVYCYPLKAILTNVHIYFQDDQQKSQSLKH